MSARTKRCKSGLLQLAVPPQASQRMGQRSPQAPSLNIAQAALPVHLLSGEHDVGQESGLQLFVYQNLMISLNQGHLASRE